jgi:hypothetical protein
VRGYINIYLKHLFYQQTEGCTEVASPYAGALRRWSTDGQDADDVWWIMGECACFELELPELKGKYMRI